MYDIEKLWGASFFSPQPGEFGWIIVVMIVLGVIALFTALKHSFKTAYTVQSFMYVLCGVQMLIFEYYLLSALFIFGALLSIAMAVEEN